MLDKLEQPSLPRIMISDRRTALARGRYVLRTDVELPLGFDALPKPEKQRLLDEKFAESRDVACAILVESDR